MLTALLLSLVDQYGWLNVFSYLTFRGILAVLTALALGIALGPYCIRLLQRHQCGQIIREDDVPFHKDKAGTPTMGGALICFTLTVSTLLWADLMSPYIWLVLGTCLTFAAIGFIDDYLKIRRQNSHGLRARQKILLQTVAALCVAIALGQIMTPAEQLYIVPFAKDVAINAGVLFIPLTALVLVAASNGVNLADGLDGLAIMPIVMIAAGFAIFSYATGHVEFSQYLQIPHIEGAGELVIFCTALVGSALAFLFFNCHPASLFLGDLGSLSLGATIGIVAVVVRQEVVLFIMSGIFVVETLSVMMQVVSYQMFGKRIWLMAPIHHHYELKFKMPEQKLVVRFWIVSLMFVLAGLATLKIR